MITNITNVTNNFYVAASLLIAAAYLSYYLMR